MKRDKTGELFYVDKSGKKHDAALHDEMLNGISPEGNERVLSSTRSRTKQLGMDERVNQYLEGGEIGTPPAPKRTSKMPLIKSGSKKAISSNIREMVRAGHPQRQAVAAALSTARRYGKAAGGASSMQNLALKGSSIGLGRQGMINSTIPGRTDKLPMKVKAGSYILPADIPSALGQGNTMAGGEVLKKMFSTGPYGLTPMKGGRGGTSGRKLKGFQDGGEVEEGGDDEHVPIIAAGGEYVIHPDVVKAVGHGDMKKGHDVLDKFVVHTRKKHIEILKKLPEPKK